jgi:hypothetical protein
MPGVALVSGVALADAPRAVAGRSAGREKPLLVGSAGATPTGVARSAWIGATDVVSLLGIVFAIPLVVLAIGVPIALAVRLLLWVGRLL